MLYLHLAIDNIISQFKRFMLSILLVVISLVIIIYLVTIYESQGYGYNTCDKLLNRGFEGAGIITVDYNNGIENLDKFMNAVCKREEIDIFGGMENYRVAHVEEEIHNIQLEGNDDYFKAKCEEKSCLTTVISMNLSCLKMCDLNIKEGIKPEDLKFNENDDEKYVEHMTYIYVGSAYSSIPIGTEQRKAVNVDGVTYSYVRKVVGIMQEGQRWVDPHISYGVDPSDMEYTVDCTYGVFEVSNSFTSNDFWIAPSDGYSLEAAMAAAYEVADEYDIDIWYRTLYGIYEQSCNHTILVLSYFRDILLLIIPAMMLMLIAMQIVSVMHELNNFGVLCSVGYSIKDINIMLIIKNIIMAIVSLGIATPMVMYLFGNLYEGEFNILANTLLLSTALPLAILIMIIVILITSATTVVMLKRYTPVKLMSKRT